MIEDSLEVAESATVRALVEAESPQVCHMANKLMSSTAVGHVGSVDRRGHQPELDEVREDLSCFDCSFIILINHI